MEKFDDIQDTYYVQKLLIPYLSSVYYSLIARGGGTKDYLTSMMTKQYLNMTEALADRILQ